jgi:AraC family transcriptional regulator of adaptative response/methylated-DNA-[protein]-cysteine methyltransferase
MPEWVAALMARLEESPGARVTDADLLRLGIGPVRARRWFRRRFGVTFQMYQRTLR